ncbi:MAG: HAD family hydrolase [Gammaproteobacteria bacterium]|nr:MAG: HAD family hydrolase [Gammaproteobacteria bacterium]RKZ97815.1 MAG: HAD family hydrolase [Gammaproteobacteria bacterium]RLA01667.1 MAG: HAD family hydrolase [Gammaproteobacteria bacterium]
MAKKKLYALDFDGVICDSAVETGITGWKVATQLWQDMPADTPTNIIDQFRQVRPVMETGYEAILIIRLLFEGLTPEKLLNDFTGSINALIEHENLEIDQLKALFGETRDHWINRNLDEWVEMNPLFDNISSKLQQLDPQQCYIITTKQERFVSHILDANELTLPPEQIFGLDRKLSKQQILADLLSIHPKHTILFVEDRLPTLENVIGDERLADIELFFADWGYNTQQDKLAATTLAVTIISLAGFSSL